jgi:hypothetical protein
MITNFNKFNSINEELEMSTDLYGILEILKAKKDKIAEFLMKIRISRDAFIFSTDYIDLGSNLTELSFLAKNRVDTIDWLANFEDSRRQSIKTGRLVRKIITDLKTNKLTFTYTGQFYFYDNNKVILNSADQLSKDDIKFINALIKLNGKLRMSGKLIGELNIENGNIDEVDSQQINVEAKAESITTTEQIWSKYRFYNGKNIAMVDYKYEPLTFIKSRPVLVEGTVTFDGTPTFTDSDIEKFVNEFLALRKELNLDEIGVEFKIVEGDDVAKYYHYSTYHGYENRIHKGTLWNSCMRLNRCQKYFSIYTNNPGQVKMLILVTKEDKIVGRALLWYLDDISTEDELKDISIEGVFMDRIYSINDSDEKLFINYAIKNGWSYKDNTKSICKDNEQLPNAILRVSLDNDMDGTYYPYLDTLCYLTDNRDVLMLTNDSGFDYDYVLNSTNGTWQGADESYDDVPEEDEEEDN